MVKVRRNKGSGREAGKILLLLIECNLPWRGALFDKYIESRIESTPVSVTAIVECNQYGQPLLEHIGVLTLKLHVAPPL